MRNVLRRITFGVLGTGMVVAMAAGATAVSASAAVAAPHHATATKSVALSWPAVRQGASGNRVRAIQYLLNQSGFKVTVDGQFGPTTTAQVKAFQKVNGLAVDGVVGDATWPQLILTVKQGATGDAVKAVQDYLKRAYGFSNLQVDGKFGASTTTAVKDFQKEFKITVDGIVSPVTWNTLIVKHV
jgi:peptidoglycan hydrolase-like protein with peptidoglycan-binding domain